MATLPPNFKFGGPPPGNTPVGLSAMKTSPLRAEAPPVGDPEAQGGGGAGIAKMFYALEQSIDSLASALPEQAAEFDKVKSALREIMASAVSRGAAFVKEDEWEPGVLSGPSEPLV